MLETEIDFTAATDVEIVEFIVADLARFHEEQSEAPKVKQSMVNNLAAGAFFIKSRHGFALIRPPASERPYVVLNYLFSCAKGYGTQLIERAREECKGEGKLLLRCYTDRLRDYYTKRGFTVHSSENGGHTMEWIPAGGIPTAD